jgi:hypothetical protein
MWLMLLTPLGKLAPASPTPWPKGSFPLFSFQRMASAAFFRVSLKPQL